MKSGHGGHFTAGIRFRGSWYLYDDMSQNNPAGKHPSRREKLVAPPGYRPHAFGFSVTPKEEATGDV